MDQTILSTDLWLRRVQHINVFPKYSRKYAEAQKRTPIGAAFTIITLLVLIYIVHSEIKFYRSVELVTQVAVDDEVHETIPFFINMTFPRADCKVVELETVDIGGKAIMHDDSQNSIVKTVVEHESEQSDEDVAASGGGQDDEADSLPTPQCGSCYGAEDDANPCCRSCQDIIAAYLRRGWHLDDFSNYKQCAHHHSGGRRRSQYPKGIGCNIVARLTLNRVQGNIHILAGHGMDFGGQHVHQMGLNSFDASHIIHRLSFGVERREFYGSLDGRAEFEDGDGLFRYYLNIVPTLFFDINNTRHDTYQYSVTTHFRSATGLTAEQRHKNEASNLNPQAHHGHGHRTHHHSDREDDSHPSSPPSALQQQQRRNPALAMMMQRRGTTGVYFLYNLSPVELRVTQRRPYRSLLHFLLNLCAVAGGVFTVAALLDSIVNTGVEKVQEKMRMGKQS
eukprot:PhM_4_TR2357/c0_g2_i1/m.54357/K20367/ERGIC3, ERV46; endoplasmic reticulum-Golgi intermediate compartment protein 3